MVVQPWRHDGIADQGELAVEYHHVAESDPRLHLLRREGEIDVELADLLG